MISVGLINQCRQCRIGQAERCGVAGQDPTVLPLVREMTPFMAELFRVGKYDDLPT